MPWPVTSGMPYDGIFASAIVRELQETLGGARIDKIYQPEPHTILLHCRQPGASYKLVLSAHPRHPRVHLTTASPANPLQAPVFAMTLRKHLDPGRIVHIEQHGLDRIITLVVDGFDEVGRPAQRRLIAELTGRNSNIVLVDGGTGRIIDALKRVNARVNLYRALLPGEPYMPPPTGDRINPLGRSPSALMEAFAQGATARDIDLAAADADTVVKLLPQLFEGLSPFAASETSPLPDEPGGTLPLAHRLHGLLQRVEQGRFNPALRRNAKGAPVDVWAFVPRQWPQAQVETMEGANKAADALYTFVLSQQAVESRRRQLLKVLAGARKRLARKAHALQQDLLEAIRADQYRIFGEMLTANLHLVGRGSEATVPNYYDEGRPITIPLDPKLGPAANAQRHFKRYAKLKTAAAVVQRQLDGTEADLAWLEQVSVFVRMAEDGNQLADISQELLASGIIPRHLVADLEDRSPRRTGVRNRSRRPAPTPVREFVLSDGNTLLVGGNGRQNDRLSLRLARPDDLWLHVKDMPGAHVLLPVAQLGLGPGGTPPADLVREAAAFAAHFSKARDSTNVPVDVTLAKHVRKPRGARPGMVIYDHHHTVYVCPATDAQVAQAARRTHRPDNAAP